MSLEVCVLGSGSGGNSTVIRCRGVSEVLLLDAGFGPRATAKRLSATGVSLEQIRAICLTHLDSDHFNTNWVATVIKLSIRIHCHADAVSSLLHQVARQCGPKAEGFDRLITPFATATDFEPLPGLRLHPIHLHHDETGSHGFVISAGHDAARLGYATDLGQVPAQLIEKFAGVDLLMLESNYDPAMEENSDRPYYLKARIMGGSGHLSNDQAFAAVRAILDRTEKHHGPQNLPRHIVLLHRSRQCNCPILLRKLFQRDARIKPVLTLAEQSTPTAWLRLQSGPACSGAQLSLELHGGRISSVSTALTLESRDGSAKYGEGLLLCDHAHALRQEHHAPPDRQQRRRHGDDQ